MPFDYVSDYEAVTGQKIPDPEDVFKSLPEVKVVAAPTVRTVEPETVAETKTVEGE